MDKALLLLLMLRHWDICNCRKVEVSVNEYILKLNFHFNFEQNANKISRLNIISWFSSIVNVFLYLRKKVEYLV